MKFRGVLKTFYTGFQFAMLLVSIPKVASLFAAYDPHTTADVWVFGLPLTDWLIGIAIDLCAALTSWAALNKFEISHAKRDLLPPGLIVAICAALSSVANYESAAAMRPAFYAHLSGPWLDVNPFIVACPPLLVLLCIMLVPSITAAPVVKSAEELAEEARRTAAKIEAEALLKEAQARANARVRVAQAQGARATFYAARGKHDPGLQPDPDGGPGGGLSVLASAEQGADETQIVQMYDEDERRAMRNAEEREQAVAEVQRRVRRSGGRVRAADLQTVLNIGDSRARDIVKGACGGVADESGHYTAPVGEIVRYLRRAGTASSTAQATRVWEALRPRKKARSNGDAERGLPAPDSQPLPLPVRTLQRDSDEDDGAEEARVLAFSGRGASR